MEPLIPGYYYHIYNHANGNEQLIQEDKNYEYFLEKMKTHILPIADFYAFCLMPNHFHFLVRIKDEAEIQTQAFNRMYNRRGSLFLKNFKRKRIHDENYFLRLVNYIHFNPVVHGFVNRPSEWNYSSFNAIISNKKTLVKREELLEWFDGLENFNYCHLHPLDI